MEPPSALGHVPEHLGVERAPKVLRAAGLADGLAARRAGRIEAAGYSAERDPGTKVINPAAIRSYSALLADAVAAVPDAGEFPIVLGGDCSILLGTMLALRRRGRYGLLCRRRCRLLPAGGQSTQRRCIGERSGVRNRPRA